MPFDPFEVLPLGKAALRVRLRVVTRPELLGIIQNFDLNALRERAASRG